jgi:hypothetical protein
MWFLFSNEIGKSGGSMRQRGGFVWWLVLALLAGCAAERDSRNLASQLRRLAADHKALTTRKIEAEKQFYVDSIRNLSHTLNVVEPTAPQSAQPEVTKTAAYVRILTNANADTLALAEGLVKGGGAAVTAGTIARFLQEGVKDEQDAFLLARQMQAEAVKVLSLDLAKLNEYQVKLAILVRELTELEKDSSISDRLSQLRAIGEAVHGQLKQP